MLFFHCFLLKWYCIRSIYWFYSHKRILILLRYWTFALSSKSFKSTLSISLIFFPVVFRWLPRFITQIYNVHCKYFSATVKLFERIPFHWSQSSWGVIWGFNVWVPQNYKPSACNNQVDKPFMYLHVILK